MLKRWQRLLLVLIILSGAAVGSAALARAQSYTEFPLTHSYRSWPLGIGLGRTVPVVHRERVHGLLWNRAHHDNRCDYRIRAQPR